MKPPTGPSTSGPLRLAVLLCCLLALSLPGPTRAGAITPQAALDRLFTAPSIQAAWFAPGFLGQVSVDQVTTVVDGLKSALGRYEGSKPQPDGTYLLTFQKGTDVAQISLDAQGRIDGLLFKPPQFKGASLDTALQGFRGLPGKVSLLVVSDGTTRGSLNAAEPLGVGSAFKLGILAALQRQIAAGTHSWGEVAILRAQDRSLPSGILQSWPISSHVTIETLASLMISQSDNTAADTLLHLVGRDAVDAVVPARDRPYLTTHAFFVLKDPKNAALRRSYLKGSPAQKLAVIERAEKLPLPNPSIFGAGPRALDVEWFYTPGELCGLMAQVYQLPLMGINPGLASPADWRHIAFKGGSEPGVLNLTTMVTSHSGVTSCVSASWNNTAALDEGRFEGLYAAVLAGLKG